VRIVLYAASTPHASELVETARRLGWEIAASVRNLPGVAVPAEVPRVIDLDELDPSLLELDFAVPQTSPPQRYAAIADARARGFGRSATMADPSAAIAESSTLGEGCYVGAGSVIGAATSIGTGALINRSCSVAHHVSVGEYAGTGPGVVLAGACRVRQGAFIGAGAVIAPEVTVGVGAFVGAGAVVIADVSPGDVVVGNPARALRRAEVPAGLPWS
jgi:sugar O-acyltransferase (sialic acid O-acetyltransferase NeuD family)